MLILDAVCKTFIDPERGNVPAVQSLSTTLTPGITALLGANGAGKSTLLRLISTLLQADSGRIIVDGYDCSTHPAAVRSRIGYLSLNTRLYPRLTAREMLAYAGGFFDLTGERLRERIESVNETFLLHDFIDQRCDSLSSGQAQRVNLARTLLLDPPVLILDEPTTGLDVIAAQRMVEAVADMRKDDRLIILCTHLLHEAEELADHALIMRDGCFVHDGPCADLGSGQQFIHAIHELVRPVTKDSA